MARRGKAIWGEEPGKRSHRPWAFAAVGLGAGALLGLTLVFTGVVRPADPAPAGPIPLALPDLPAVAPAPSTASGSRGSPGEYADMPAAARPFPEIGFCRGRSGDNCVIDGDSFILEGETVRLAGIDAPEMGNPGCAAEAELAEIAEQRLHQLLNEGPIELVANADRDRDRYGRLLRDALVAGSSVSDALVAEGLARPWRGAKEDWC